MADRSARAAISTVANRANAAKRLRRLPEVNVTLLPDEKGVESLARQIKITARAYPLFDIARLILQKPERYSVVFSVKKNAEGKPIQPLFLCALDDSLWLSEEEAVAHVLQKHFATFYQAERTATEPPKGKYTFVAQCGMSGVILGPPNYHDYQNQLRKLHAERFARMPFEMFKARVKIVRDEAVVKKWVEDQSFKTEYVCLNMPEPLQACDSRGSGGKTFPRNPQGKHHQAGRIAHAQRRRSAQSAEPRSGVAGAAVWEDQRRFPLQIATVAEPAVRVAWACNFSRSTKPSRTFRSRARIIWIWKPRRCRKA